MEDLNEILEIDSSNENNKSKKEIKNNIEINKNEQNNYINKSEFDKIINLIEEKFENKFSNIEKNWKIKLIQLIIQI